MTTLQERAFERWGAQRQMLALIEELGEAMGAVARLLNEKGDRSEVVEEIVDVESVVASLRDFLARPEEWASIREVKAAKLAAALARGDPRTRAGGDGA